MAADYSFSPRTLPAYRLSYFVNEKYWITTRTPLYYLDLAVSNKTLFVKHYERVFPEGSVEYDREGAECFSSKKQGFHPDDTSVGRDGREDSNLFYLYAATPDKKRDMIGVNLFFLFARTNASLTSGESAFRFLNLATLCGYQQFVKSPTEPYIFLASLLCDIIFSCVYPDILKGICEKKSELLLKKFWDCFCVTVNNRLSLFELVPDARHLEFMLEVANETRFDFWGYRYGGDELFTERVVMGYLEDGRCDLISVMLDYGFALYLGLPRNLYTTEIPLTISFLNYASRESIPNSPILLFLVRCYESCSNLIELPGFIDVFQKMSRKLPVPFQPPSIVREFLLKALDSPRAVEEITAIYGEAVHPSDCNSGVAPQTLSHLSRCVLRERMSANYLLPTAIVDSHLPTLIKRFLRLDF